MESNIIDLTPMLRGLSEMLSRVTSQEVLNEVGEILVSSVQQNFEVYGRFGEKEGEGGSKKWADVSEDYAEYKKLQGKDPANILLYTGQLRSSITYRVEGNTVFVGTNKDYSEYLNDGAGLMPARPFLVIQPEDVDDIEDAVRQAIERGE